MTHLEYLVSYGPLGDFGRFHAMTAVTCRRGRRAVVRTPRGLEIGTVLGEARPGHAHFLPNTTVGQLLRLATPDDEAADRRRRDDARRLFEEARACAAALALPMEVIDAEVLLDGEHAVIHHVHWADFDPRPFVSGLSRSFEVHLTLFDLTHSAAPGHEDETEEHGCGRPGCGSESGSGCGSGGGCSTCGLKEVFAGLRERMEQGDRKPV